MAARRQVDSDQDVRPAGSEAEGMEVLLVQVRGPAEGGRGSGKQVLLLLLLVVW